MFGKKPLGATGTSGVIYDRPKKLFNGAVTENMDMNHVLCVIEGLFEEVFKGNSLDCIDLEALGIKCPDKKKSKECIVFEYLLENMRILVKNVGTLQQSLTIIQTAVTVIRDEKVKVKAAGTPGYLVDILSGPPDTIEFTDNKVSFRGFVPVGFRGTISRHRLPDFDGNGKGKPNTDVWGWHLSNGNNGTQNLLGTFVAFTDTLNNAETKSGNTSFTVEKKNIHTFSVPVTGTINDALSAPVEVRINHGVRNKCFGIGGCRDVLVPDDGADKVYTQLLNLKHSHTFSLTATHSNATPEPIPLVPEHIKLIPIERINP